MRIFSGIRASGAKTLGNYSGGFRQYAATQEQGEAFFCIVDLHSITTPFEPGELREATLDLGAMLFATGLDPDVGARIKNLQEPERLMSTTRGAPQGVVRIVDPPEVIRKKFKTAVTDSGTDVRHAPDEKPGITNLLEIMSVATGDPISDIEARYDGSGYGQFKEDVAEAVVGLFGPIQQRHQELRADEGELRAMLARGADKAREASAPTLEQMYERMGFVRR